jgi:cobaltochelatase CobT
MAEAREGKAEEFKRVLSTAMKTIADDPELTVSFGNETPSLSGNKAKLPQVTSQFTPKDIAITRGLSDSFALRLSNDSDQVHSKYRPEGKNARAVFEAVEQARIKRWGPIPCPAWRKTWMPHWKTVLPRPW